MNHYLRVTCCMDIKGGYGVVARIYRYGSESGVVYNPVSAIWCLSCSYDRHTFQCVIVRFVLGTGSGFNVV